MRQHLIFYKKYQYFLKIGVRLELIELIKVFGAIFKCL